MYIDNRIVNIAEFYNHFLYYDVIFEILPDPDNVAMETNENNLIYCQRSILESRCSYFKSKFFY